MAHTTIEQAWITFHTRLLHFVRQRVADDASAEDIVQDVFVKAHTHIDSLMDATKLQAWLYQLTRNAIADYYRRTRPALPLSENIVLLTQNEEDTASMRLTPAVKQMVAALPDIYREALYLTEYEGLTQKELAVKLGLSLSGAKSRVQRARQMLRQMLLDCCHFEFDQRNAIISYQPRCSCCTANDCP